MLGRQSGELCKRAASGRHLALADHVRHLDTLERCRRKDEGLETQHRSNVLLDDAVILLDNVVKVFDPDHLDRDRASETPQHSVDRADSSSVGSAAVDDDLAG